MSKTESTDSSKQLYQTLKKGAKHLFDVPVGSNLVPVYETRKVGQEPVNSFGLAICHPTYAVFLDGDPDIRKKSRRQTLLHELIHIIDDVYTLGLDETAVRVLENALWQVLKTRKL